MRKLYPFLIALLLLGAEGICETKTIVRQSKGQGFSREEAIKKGLAEAVAQARGVAIRSGDYDFKFKSAGADFENEQGARGLDFGAVSVEADGSLLRTDIDGLVKTYEVIREKKLDEGSWEVELKVWIYDYESLYQTNRKKLAVMPVKTVREQYRFGDLVLTSTELSQKMSQQLSAGFAGTNKYAVLDREYILDFAHERHILLSGDAPIEEMAKAGNVMGADLMLVGTISDARVEIREWDSSAIGRRIYEYDAYFVFDYRVLVGPTRQVRVADSVRLWLETDEVKDLVEDWRPGALDYREMIDNMVIMAADEVVGNVIDKLNPIRIAKVTDNGEVIINQGGKRIPNGMLLDVLVEGGDVIDEETNESLGKIESLVATISVYKVTDGFSYAKVIDGDISKVSKGLLCRFRHGDYEGDAGRKSSIEQTPSGGVSLPFD